MKLVFSLVLSLSVVFSANLAAQDVQAETGTSVVIPYGLLNNDYYRESLRQRNLARLTLQEGEYDTSANHSEEAERYARLSDEYIARRLLESRLGTAMQNARDRLAWARANEAAVYFPSQLQAAEAHYNIARGLQSDNELQGALENARAVINDLLVVAAPPPRNEKNELLIPENLPLKPDQYVVRPWDKFGDCFWNIADRFYGNPRQWPMLYEANKHKIPDQNNPNLIEVGTVIDIPGTTNQERRTGVYDTGTPYPQP